MVFRSASFVSRCQCDIVIFKKFDVVTIPAIKWSVFLFDHQKELINIWIKMPGNNFGWSLSDAVANPRQTGLVNFRRYKLLQYHQSNAAAVSGDDEDLSTKNRQCRLNSEETTTQLEVNGSSIFPFSRPVKPYYGRENSVSQCSDSCFGSDYPSLTSTGILLSFFPQKAYRIKSKL